MFKAATLRNQLLLNDKHVFSYTYSRAKLHDATPEKKNDYEKSKKKHQNKKYNTSSNKMLTLGIGAEENKQNKVGVKLTIGRRERFYFAFFFFYQLHISMNANHIMT